MKKSILTRVAAVTGAAAIAISGATATASAQTDGSMPETGSLDPAFLGGVIGTAQGLSTAASANPVLFSTGMPFVVASAVLCPNGACAQ